MSVSWRSLIFATDQIIAVYKVLMRQKHFLLLLITLKMENTLDKVSKIMFDVAVSYEKK